MVATEEIHKVYHHMCRAGHNMGFFISDLIFSDQGPIVVIEWDRTPAGDIPSVTVLVNPHHLHRLQPPWPNANYTYELSVEDPRPFD